MKPDTLRVISSLDENEISSIYFANGKLESINFNVDEKEMGEKISIEREDIEKLKTIFNKDN